MWSTVGPPQCEGISSSERYLQSNPQKSKNWQIYSLKWFQWRASSIWKKVTRFVNTRILCPSIHQFKKCTQNLNDAILHENWVQEFQNVSSHGTLVLHTDIDTAQCSRWWTMAMQWWVQYIPSACKLQWPWTFYFHYSILVKPLRDCMEFLPCWQNTPTSQKTKLTN